VLPLGHLFERTKKMNGIGSYFNPVPAVRVGLPQAAPATGVGAYYDPRPLRPVSPPQSVPATSTNGLGVSMSLDDSGTRAAMGLLLLVALGFFLLRKK